MSSKYRHITSLKRLARRAMEHRECKVISLQALNESKQLFASKYITELPSEEELRKELERERAELLRLQDNETTKE